jgi:iron complex outermembrane receptor protein
MKLNKNYLRVPTTGLPFLIMWVFGVANAQTNAPTTADGQFSTGSNDARIFIRGVRLDLLSPGSDPRVAIYTDQVHYARAQTGLPSFFDVDRIEILEGPQGSLYGRNATSGAINIIFRDPGDKSNGYATVTFDNYGLVQTEGAEGGALNDTIAGWIAFITEDHSGYGTNISTGGPMDDAHRGAVRAKLEIKLPDYATTLLQVDYASEDDRNGGLHFLAAVVQLAELDMQRDDQREYIRTEAQDTLKADDRVKTWSWGVTISV